MKYCFTYLILIFSLTVFCQKYNFVNWTVEDGLIQSQASYICQDHYRQLWIGTQGGLSKFDGKKFTGYTVQDGLTVNPVNVLACDKNGNIWIGTASGLSVFNGKKFTNVKLSNEAVNAVSEIIFTDENTIYTLNNHQLYSITSLTAKQQSVSGDPLEKVYALSQNENGVLLAFVLGKGIYVKERRVWRLLISVQDSLKKKNFHTIFITSNGDTLLASHSGLCQVKYGQIENYNRANLSEVPVLCVAEDQKKNLWLGTDNGVYKINGSEIIHFDAKSGLTDNSVNNIYKDVENNVWFATDADGIYKFRENTFTYYDKSSGLSSTIIMSVAQTSDGNIYAAGYGGGLYKIDPKFGLEAAKNELPILVNSKINSIYADDQNNLWIGTIGKGIWKYNEKQGTTQLEAKNNPDLRIRGATCFLKDAQGNLLIGGNQGLFVKDKQDNIIRTKMDRVVITAIKQFSADSIVVGTSKGIYMLDRSYNVKPVSNKPLNNASVLCLDKNKYNILVGTTEEGVINWNLKTDEIFYYNTTNGLPSNFIYNICLAEKHTAWIGTGFGISNLQLNEKNNLVAIKNYGRSDGLLGMECSHNCVLKATDSSLWFGTTKGLFHFNPSTEITEKNKPLVLLRSVKLFSSEITNSTLYKNAGSWFHVPEGLKLKSGQNHLTFELGAIYFTNPEDVLYKYKLEGIDKDFTTSANPYVIYPALPPGKYNLKVSGITKSGATSVNTIDYHFEIEKAFYQTRFFQFFVVLLLIATGAIIAYIFTLGRQKRKQRKKELLEKIREEEFVKLRQRTAEDFHDEMGNNLTRISVLADVLKSKIGAEESDVKNLVQQIKENTNALYNGSRDIIWSLNSQNDGLYEIAEHLKDIGNELFQETAVDFNFSHNINRADDFKLKLDHSRNLIMIFKEVYNNILKHAGANQVEVILFLKHDHELEIRISDNGTGFNMETIKNGNGIKNITNRVNRLNGLIHIDSVKEKGTEINISLKNSFV